MKFNNRGFAITSIIYSMLILFLTLVVLILGNLASRKAIFDKQKEDILDKFEQQSGLPSIYQAVEYIESTGTEYINTGYIPTVTTKIVIKLTYGEETAFGSESVLWTETPPGTTGFVIAGHTGHQGNDAPTEYVKYFRSDGDKIFYDAEGAGPYKIEMRSSGVRVMYSDGSSSRVYYEMTGPGESELYPAYVFARNTAGTATGFSSRKIYYLQIYNGLELVRDFVPCYNKNNGDIGLYDLVGRKFYTNLGTGAFRKGSDIQIKD